MHLPIKLSLPYTYFDLSACHWKRNFIKRTWIFFINWGQHTPNFLSGNLRLLSIPKGQKESPFFKVLLAPLHHDSSIGDLKSSKPSLCLRHDSGVWYILHSSETFPALGTEMARGPWVIIGISRWIRKVLSLTSRGFLWPQNAWEMLSISQCQCHFQKSYEEFWHWFWLRR